MNFLRAWVLVVAIAAWPLAGHAAGLGKIYILSGLGQPLRVEIDLLVDKKEADEVSAKLASPFTYERSGLSWLSALGTTKVTVDKRANGENFIRITTTQSVNEPFVELLLDLKWPSGSIQRQYTVLLDPPIQSAERERAAAAAQTGTTAEPGQAVPAAAVPEVKQEAKPEVKVVPSPVEAEPVPMPAPERTAVQETQPAELPPEPSPAVQGEKIATQEPAAEPAPTAPVEVPAVEPSPAVQAETPAPDNASSVTPPAKSGESAMAPVAAELGATKRGDNLTKIAKKVMPAGVTLEQMLVLLFRANPEAFDGNNMNRLRTGKVLRVPDAQEASGLSPKEARHEFALQAADWQAYRDNLASAAVKVAPMEEPAQSAGGKITPKVEDTASVTAEKPKEVLKLSKAEPAAEGKPGTAGTSNGTTKPHEEDVVAGGKQLNEANTRINKLEESLKNAQKLLELKNQGMTAAQKQTKPESGKDTKPELAQAVTPPAPISAEAPTKNGGPASQSPPGVPPAAPVQSTPATTPPPAAQATAKPAPKPPTPVKSPGLMDMVMNNLIYVAGGAIIILLGGILGFRSMRRKGVDKAAANVTPAAALESPGEAGAPAVGEQTKSFNPSETDGMSASRDATIAEEVDPVAEAEIFLAYGRDAQAEELLKEAMHANPGRLEVHSKLLQVYANRKDAKAFEAVARELQSATGGQGEIWMQATRLGYSIDPQNARYAAGRTEGSEPQIRTTQFPTTADPVTNLDFDVGVGSVGMSTQTDIDLSGGDLLTQSQIIDLGDEKSEALESSNASRQATSAGAAQTMDFRLDVPSAGSTRTGPLMPTDTFIDLDTNRSAGASGSGKQNGNGGADFDINSLALSEHPEGRTEPTAAGSIPDLDLGDLNLDMGAPTTVIGGPMKDEHWQNVQTKFDLAKAYQEMGDKEGAREILREVVQEGDTEQRSAAQSLLTSLS